ncbi:cytochrome d ubiquinol oxidase subunit II [Photobacterium sp. DA100]|uniref:cytochrome d ubiquinol oxidase subunit II n=1 Tax=Photobacterium sp. DA100 TaxID=3027472 RepID=UPI00247A5C30|nr:cytochrome d ubiquinol oxidase subunit II [Photobacterium sp. DA100]WEM43590.1 cytochrome d ubiquinol oxidase subunit II [Photobacterium sp. DA100]
MDYALIWYILIAVAVFAYVILDGFDLGIGILFISAETTKERDLMMNSIAPVWDGNETWLVLGGGGLFAVFPLAYAVAMPALYALIIMMLLGLIFRGVAFEYRFRTKRGQFLWDSSFFLGSLIATFTQGMILGTLLQGVSVTDRAYSGGWFDWFTPFSVYCGFVTVAAYTLLGACWLLIKMPEGMYQRFYVIAKRCALIMVAMVVILSLWLPLGNATIAERWFTFPQALLFLLIPGCSTYLVYLLFKDLMEHKPVQAYLVVLGLFFLAFLGFGVSTYPYIVPHAITYAEAAAPDTSLKFLLSGAVFLLPLIIAYTAYSYWVFRGKLKEDEGYH